jgi:hypothetical protein
MSELLSIIIFQPTTFAFKSFIYIYKQDPCASPLSSR